MTSPYDSALRFRPPAFEMDPDVTWVLERAFGPVDRPSATAISTDRVLGWAQALGVRERIADRVPLEDLERELSPEAADTLRLERDQLAARTLLLQELLDKVVGRARDLGLTVIALKGVALLEAGHVQYGRRRLIDLDLLVPATGAAELSEGLREDGLVIADAGEPHHLPTLVDRRLGAVELHLHLPGLVNRDGEPVTAASLEATGAIRSSPRLATLSLPLDEVLIAHAIAHALDQHGWSPAAYPVTRLCADLLDIAHSRAAPFVPEGARTWLPSAASGRELEALARLCSELEAGEVASLDGDPARLLHHTLVGLADPSYRRRLRRRAALRALRRGHWSKFRTGLTPRTVGLPE